MPHRIDLTNLIHYFHVNQGAGHTVSLFMGADNVDKPTIVVVHSREHGEQLAKEHPNPNIRYVCAEDIESRNALRGMEGVPILVDNAVIYAWLHRYQGRVQLLSKRNEKLTNMIKKIQDHCDLSLKDD